MSLPNMIDPSQPPDTQDISLGAARIREGRQAEADILGIPTNINIVQALFGADAAGLKKVQFADNAADPTIDGQMCRNGSALRIRLGGVVYTVAPSAPSTAQTFVTGQGRLTILGPSAILLSPYNGNQLQFPSGPATIPAAGIQLAPTGLVANTTYYIYAVQASGTVTSLEASTTGRSTYAPLGIQVKSTDSTRVLVGMARPITGPVWSYSTNQRLIINWYSRNLREAHASFTADRTTASTVLTEINPEIRVEFLTWADDAVQGAISGSAFNNTPGAYWQTSLAYDGTVVASVIEGIGPAPVTVTTSIGLSSTDFLSEGWHQATVQGSVSSGVGTWIGSTVPNLTKLRILFNG